MKKFLSMALIAAMTLSLAACGGNSGNEADSTGADNASSDKTYVIATDTVFAPFEFTDENVRNALNHIQKEEQERGEQLYHFMFVNNMYQQS